MLTKSINGRICYEANCPVCNSYMGFRVKALLSKPCRACATRIAKTGKPSPKKGIKTGKVAWNNKGTSPEQRILNKRLSRRIRHALSGRGLSKNWQNTFDLLGFSAETLKSHLESKFQPGMSWQNIGEWHIDHVIPDSWFKYSSINDDSFKKSWSLENLQPMWRLENISKNNRYAGEFQCQQQ